MYVKADKEKDSKRRLLSNRVNQNEINIKSTRGDMNRHNRAELNIVQAKIYMGFLQDSSCPLEALNNHKLPKTERDKLDQERRLGVVRSKSKSTQEYAWGKATWTDLVDYINYGSLNQSWIKDIKFYDFTYKGIAQEKIDTFVTGVENRIASTNEIIKIKEKNKKDENNLLNENKQIKNSHSKSKKKVDKMGKDLSKANGVIKDQKIAINMKKEELAKIKKTVSKTKKPLNDALNGLSRGSQIYMAVAKVFDVCGDIVQMIDVMENNPDKTTFTNIAIVFEVLSLIHDFNAAFITSDKTNRALFGVGGLLKVIGMSMVISKGNEGSNPKEDNADKNIYWWGVGLSVLGTIATTAATIRTIKEMKADAARIRAVLNNVS